VLSRAFSFSCLEFLRKVEHLRYSSSVLCKKGPFVCFLLSHFLGEFQILKGETALFGFDGSSTRLELLLCL
jgi:hypothetical protein